MKVVIVVSGGVVTAVYSDESDVEVELIDFDDANEDEETVEQCEEDLEAAKEKLHLVW